MPLLAVFVLRECSYGVRRDSKAYTGHTQRRRGCPATERFALIPRTGLQRIPLPVPYTPGSSVGPLLQPAYLDVAGLDSVVRFLLQHALAPSTQRSYCSCYNIQPLPIEQETLRKYAAWLACQGVAHSSIKGYFSALRNLQISVGGTDPGIASMPVLHMVRNLQISVGGTDPGIASMPILHMVLHGIKRTQAMGQGNKPHPRLPITTDIMRTLRRSWEQQGSGFKYTMLWAACCTCVFGFLRSGEATVPSRAAYDPAVHLSIADVARDSLSPPSVVSVKIKALKTDPFRQGTTIHLGRTGAELCPVAALLSYIAARGLQDGPLFHFEDGTPLSRPALVREVRLPLSAAGMDPSPFSGHSFRIGAVTSAAAAGVEDVIIKTMGRWRSSAYQQYVQLRRSDLAAVSLRLAQ